MASNAPKTTGFSRTITSIADIVALEQAPYDELVPARNLYQLFEATAALHPERPALTVMPAGDPDQSAVALTHKELLDAIIRAANLFRSLGISPSGGAVAFLCPALPASPGAPRRASRRRRQHDQLPAQRRRHRRPADRRASVRAGHSRRSRRRRSLAEGRCGHRSRTVAAAHFGHRRQRRSRLGFASFEKSAAAQQYTLDFALTADRDTVCALFHTGGTTGRPKVVRLTHGNQIHAAWSFAQVHGLDERDAAINGFPLFHVGGTVTVGLSVLAAGGHVMIPSAYSLRLPYVIQNYWRIVERFAATIVCGVPTSIAALAEVPIGGSNVGSVRMALTGGAVLPKAVGERFEKRTGLRLFETYGMTETAAAIAFNPGRGEPLAGSAGFRAPYAQTLIAAFGSEHGSPKACAALTSGLVLVRGPQVFPGYVDPKHDQGVLTEAGWLITGDIGYLTADERLVLTGRAKDLIVRSGHNIDPAAIEDVANDFPGVQISSAVGMPDQYAGEVPILFVVPAPGRVIDLGALQAHLERNILEPPAKPRRVVVLPALPVTAVGKIFKPALRDLAIEEKAKLEIERVFGAATACSISVDQDERLSTRVHIVVDTNDEARLRELAESLASLPQTYSVEGQAP